MKGLLTVLLLFLAMVAVAEEETTVHEAIATVTEVKLEGGFYGLVTKDDRKLNPVNLAKEFQVDQLRVRITYIERPDLVSMRMWGTLIEIKTIERVEKPPAPPDDQP